MHRKGLPIVTIFCLLFSLSSQAQQVYSFTAKQAVDYAMKNSATVKNALIDIQEQRQTNKEITAAALPQLSINESFSDYFRIGKSVILFNNVPSTVQIGTKYNASGSIDVQQLLFDGQVFVGIMARNTAMAFSGKTAEVTQEQIKTNVLKIYYQLLVGQKQVTSIDANISRFGKLLNDTREIYKNGFAEKLDVNKVEVQLNNLQTEKLKADNQLAAGFEGLKFLMGMPAKDSLVLSDSLSEEFVKANVLDSNYNYKDRKEYQLLTLGKKLNEYNIKRYKLTRIPTLAAAYSYQKFAQRSEFDLFKKGQPWYPSSFVALRLNIPLFDGGGRSARIERARLDLMKTNNSLEQMTLSIESDVKQSRLRFKAALATIDAQKRNVQLAEEVYNTTKLKYEQGLGSNQEIYNAETELKVAQNNYYGALYDAINARIDYLKATGKL